LESTPLSQQNSCPGKGDVSLRVSYTAPLPQLFAAEVHYSVCFETVNSDAEKQ
jgi:hypothetical protein